MRCVKEEVVRDAEEEEEAEEEEDRQMNDFGASERDHSR